MKGHPRDVLSLVFGVMFSLLGGLVAIMGTDLAGLGLGRIWPIPVIALGLMMLLLAYGWEREPRLSQEDPASQPDEAPRR